MSISDVLDGVVDATEGGEVSIDDIFNAFGRRAYGPILFVIGVISISPIGSIPGASVFLGSLIIVLMAQYIVRDDAPWLPQWILKRRVGSKQAREAIEKVRPFFQKMERFVRPRFVYLNKPPWTYLNALCAILLALTFYPLAFVPWGVLPPSLGIALLGLGMMTSDGLILGIGLTVSLAGIVAIVLLMPLGLLP